MPGVISFGLVIMGPQMYRAILLRALCLLEPVLDDVAMLTTPITEFAILDKHMARAPAPS